MRMFRGCGTRDLWPNGGDVPFGGQVADITALIFELVQNGVYNL